MALACLMFCQCGRQLPETVPVSGQVTFAGGPPPADGIVNFLPVENTEGLPRRPGSGKFGSDGKFTVSSFNGNQGLVPGRYRVRIECLSGDPIPAPGGYEKVSYVPAGYNPDELLIEPGTSRVDELIYDIPLKK